MARKRQSADGVSDDVAEFTDEVRKLREEVQVLRDVLSEVHEELQWAVRNGLLPHDVAAPMRRITSMPLDPEAPDFAERINAIPTEQVEALRSSVATRPDELKQDASAAARHQQDLF